MGKYNGMGFLGVYLNAIYSFAIQWFVELELICTS